MNSFIDLIVSLGMSWELEYRIPNVMSENGLITGLSTWESGSNHWLELGMCKFIFLLGPYEELFDSGLTIVGPSGWCVRKIAEASDMGMIQSALD